MSTKPRRRRDYQSLVEEDEGSDVTVRMPGSTGSSGDSGSGDEAPYSVNEKGALADPLAPLGDTVQPEPWRNLVAFFVIGLINNYSYVVMLSAAIDLLEGVGADLPAGTVLLADILPTLCIKLTAPFFVHKVPYSLRVVVITLLGCGSFHVVAWTTTVHLRLFGVCMASASSGLGEITFLARASYYHRNTISAWSSGTGGAGVFGALSYLAFTSWIGWSPRTALLISSVAPILISIGYFVILLSPRPTNPIAVASSSTPQGEDVPLVTDGSLIDGALPEPASMQMTTRERFTVLVPLLTYMIPLFVVYYAEYVINQGVSPVIWFDNAPFDRKAHYRYYQFLYQSGVFISRSSVTVFPIRRIWILPILQVANLLLLLSHALWRFLPSVFIVFVVILWEGLLGGAVYCNAFYLITQRVEKKYVEYSLGVTSVADTFGIALAGVTSIFLEPALKRHCGIACSESSSSFVS